MYLHRWVLLVSLVGGLLGSVAAARAFTAYRDAARAYSQVEVVYVPGSFDWRDAGLTTARIELDILNRPPRQVPVEFLTVNLYLDGQFVGSDYTTWQPLAIARQADARVETTLQIAGDTLRAGAPSAEIALRGEVRLRFDSIERPLALRFRSVVSSDD